jgi:hypothetical protein
MIAKLKATNMAIASFLVTDVMVILVIDVVPRDGGPL